MTNEELIKMARYCSTVTNPMDCEECEFKKYWFDENEICVENILKSAADALEAADKRIAELEAQITNCGARMKGEQE